MEEKVEEKEIIEIVDIDGLVQEVELVTYLNSDDDKRQYIVYSKGEVQGPEGDEIVYISKMINEDGNLKLEEIEDDAEWIDVQNMLKKIANREDTD